MIRVTIPNMPIRNQSGIGKTSGKPYSMDFQTAYFHTVGKDGKPMPFPEKSEVILDKDDKGIPQAYAPGDYQLAPASIYVDRSGSVAVAPKLIPLQPRPAA